MKRFTLFMLLLAALPFGAMAYDFAAANDGNTLYYTITDHNQYYVAVCPPTTTGWGNFPKPTGALVIPSTVSYGGHSYQVTEINESTFSSCYGLTSVSIGNSVTAIGNSAFYGCTHLTMVTIGNSVTTIGESAFWGCSGLTSLTIGNSVTTIGSGTFCHCSGLTSIEIPNSVTTIGEYAFQDCSGLTSVTIPNSVTSIGKGAFIDCSGLTSVTILSNAFASAAYTYTTGFRYIFGNQVTSYTLGSNVTAIGNRAFYNCTGLTSLTVEATTPPTVGTNAFQNVTHDIPVYVPMESLAAYRNYNNTGQPWGGFTNFIGAGNISFVDAAVKVLCVASSTGWDTNSDGELSYAEAAAVTSLDYVFSSEDITSFNELQYFTGLEYLDDDAFYACYQLTSVIIPSSVTEIGGSAFADCSSLTSVTIPSSVTDIGGSAFADCSSLTSVTIPSSVTTIGSTAFSGSGLTEMTVEATTPPTLGNNAFQNVPTSIPVYVPCGTKAAYQAAAGWNAFTNIVDPCGNIVFADAAVKALCVANWDTNGDNELSYAEAAAVTSLGEVFQDAFQVQGTSVTFNELQYFTGLTSIGENAFSGCWRLSSITLPSTVTSIESSAFAMCSSLTSINIPNSVTTIGSWAFMYCGLTAVELPNSMTTLGIRVFNNCSSLTSIEIPANVTSIGLNPFSGCNNLTSITVAGGNTHYSSPNNNCIVETASHTLISGLSNTVIPDDIQNIGNFAFSSQTGLTSIMIPALVTHIGTEAFASCANLAEITLLAETPPTVGSNAFYNVPTTIPVNVPCGTQAAYQAVAGWNAFPNIMDPCGNIVFADENVKDICVANWDTNNDGELSYLEAAAVTTLNPSGTYNNSVFKGKTNITSFDELQYFTGLTKIDLSAFSGCTNLVSVTLPGSVIQIYSSAFYNCGKITSITLPESVQYIGYQAFAKTGIISAYIPATVTSIGQGYQDKNIFSGCTALTSITVEAGNTVYSSPNGCNAIIETTSNTLIAGCKNTIIPNTITSIGEGAFNGCSGLASVTIPSGVTFIGSSAFYNCTGLQSITVEATTPPTINASSSFYNVPRNIPVNVPCGTKAAYQAATYWGDFTNFVDPCEAIVFADPAVKALCVANWDTNGDNELSYAEAAAVTNLNPTGNYNTSPFYNNQIITSFNELQYFTGLTGGGTNHAFRNCSNLASVTLPDNLEKIGTYAFNNCTSLSSITLPDGVTEIGMSAFSNTNLTSITLPTSLRIIGAYAFSGTGITSVYIPATVNAIGSGYSNSNIFYNCTALESIVVDAGNPYYDSRDNCNAIIRKSNNELISGCMNTVIPSTVTAIRDYAFYGCIGLTSITIPGNVTSIGTYVFYNCTSLTSLTVEATTPPTLGTNAFQNVPTSIPVYVPCGTKAAYQAAAGWSTFTNFVDPCDVIVFADPAVKALCVANWDSNGDGELSYPEAAAVTSLGEVFQNAFQEQGTSVTFNELQYFTGLTSIGGNAFSGCWRLSSITLPSTVTSIESSAFSMCSSLTSINIPNSVTTIGIGAFMYCGLTAVELPNSLTTLGVRVFNNCSSLTSIEIPANVTSIGLNPFSGCNNLTSITVAGGNTHYSSPNNNCIVETASHTLISGLSNTVIPDDIQNIGNFAFSSQTGLTSIVIPALVTHIGTEAFASCANLAEITLLAETPPTVGSNAFRNVPTSIPVYVPCGTKAAYQAAAGWSAFTNFVDPCDVIVFADPAVKALCVANWDSNGDGELSYPEAAAVTTLNPSGQYGNGVFTQTTISSFDELQYFTGLTTIDGDAFRGCQYLSSITFPASITSIGAEAFSDCQSLSSIAFPSALQSIDNYAFSHSGLTSVTIPATVTNIGLAPFSGCNSLASIAVADGNTVYSAPDGCNVIIKTSTNTLVQGCKNSTIPDGVTIIGAYAFHDLTSLTSVTLPGSVTLIQEEAFSNAGLASITLQGSTPPALEPLAFDGVPTDIPVYVPCGSIEAYQAATGWSNFTNYQESDVFICFADPAVKALCVANWDSNGDGQLSYDEAAAVTSISGVFNYEPITTFDELQYFTGLTTIDRDTFKGCQYLSSITFPASITSIGAEAFYNCQSLSSIAFPSALQSIGNHAFSHSGLTSVTIPATVTNIGFAPFNGCNSLASIAVADGNTVYSAPDGCNVIIKTSTNNLVQGCKNSTIPDGVTIIGAYAFHDLTSLTSVTLPGSVTLIQEDAFSNAGLASITLQGSTPPALEPWAFDGVSTDIPVNVPCGALSAYQAATDWSAFTNLIDPCASQPQVVTLAAGTNWFSSNVEITLADLQNALTDVLGTNASITISSQTQSCTLKRNRWTGTLETINLSQMYMIEIENACEISLEGEPINPANHPVTISFGENWVAFPLNVAMSLDDAFDGFAQNDDAVSSQTQNASRKRNKWTGTLTELQPGQGFIYTSSVNGDRTLVFPTSKGK